MVCVQRQWIFVMILLSIVILTLPISAVEHEAYVDEQSIGNSATMLEESIRQAVHDAGGNVDTSHIHLVLGFSTGHFADDPLGAEAARGIAGRCLRAFLIGGDQLSVYAWERHLWKHPQVEQNPVDVPDDMAGKAKLQDLFPLTPQTGSVGGHDTEQALVEIIEQLHADSDTVVVLLTNSAASVTSDGQKVIGADDPKYRTMLNDWLRLGQVNQSGASLVLPYTVILAKHVTRLRALDAVIMTPKHFIGQPINDGTRSSHLQIPAPVTKPPTKTPFPWGIVLLFITLGLVGLAFISKIFPRGGALLEVGGQRYDVASVKEGGEICHLAGCHYPEMNERSVVVSSGEQAIPPWRLARFTKEHGKVLVIDDRFKLHTVDGMVVSGKAVLTIGTKHRLVFLGEWRSDSALPPRQVRVEIDAEVARTFARGGGV